MKMVPIEALRRGGVSGVEVALPGEASAYREGFFEWRASALDAAFRTSQIAGGVLKAWRHEPAFAQIETHADREMFHFMSGTAIMLFMDAPGGRPDMDSAQIVRILPGTEIAIDAGKGHFVAVAEGDEPVVAVVVAPRMDAPRMDLPDTVKGR
jgi:mannose-6-phosphate isomerase-like protein (cupin superfamily)